MAELPAFLYPIGDGAFRFSAVNAPRLRTQLLNTRLRRDDPITRPSGCRSREYRVGGLMAPPPQGAVTFFVAEQ